MRNLLFIISLLLTCQVFAAGELAATQLGGLLKSFNTYTADFEQVTFSQNGRVLQTGEGKVMIKRPGRFRWESEMPTRQIMIASGNTLWIYDRDLAQASKQSLAKQARIDPALLLSGSVKDLETSFSVTMKIRNKQQAFNLTPKKVDLGFKQVKLLFKANKLILMVVHNNLDQITRFRFSAIVLNADLADSLFQFKPPKGVDVIAQ